MNPHAEPRKWWGKGTPPQRSVAKVRKAMDFRPYLCKPMKTNHFSSKNAAQVYAKGRPYFHHQVIRWVNAFLNLEKPVPRALDIGCGTGLSAVALKEIANNIIALDISYDMLATAPRDRHIYYINTTAENLPFAAASFDLLTVSSAFHWFDKKRFVKESRRVLRPGGWAIIYDNYFTACAEKCPQFTHWYREVYLKRYPTPPRHTAFKPEDWKDTELLFVGEEPYENIVSFTCDRLIDYLLTQTNIISAVENGRDSFGGVVKWLRKELEQFTVFDSKGVSSGEGRFVFAGSIIYLQKRI